MCVLWCWAHVFMVSSCNILQVLSSIRPVSRPPYTKYKPRRYRSWTGDETQRLCDTAMQSHVRRVPGRLRRVEAVAVAEQQLTSTTAAPVADKVLKLLEYPAVMGWRCGAVWVSHASLPCNCDRTQRGKHHCTCCLACGCVVPAIRQRSINHRHVYTKQTASNTYNPTTAVDTIVHRVVQYSPAIIIT